MENETMTLDITSTWKEAMRIYFMVLESGTEEGKRAAREDLMRLADEMDKLNAANRGGK